MNRQTADADCLELRELEQLALGELDDERLEFAQSHLEKCTSCLQRLRQVADRDSITSALEAALRVKEALAPVKEPIEELLDELDKKSPWRMLKSHAQSSRSNQTTGPWTFIGKSFEPGHVLGNYVLEGVLGWGGMGVVYKATHCRMERVVALKVISPEERRDRAVTEQFHAEVKAIARLSHPQIVTAHDADEAEGVLFLVMEYVDGRDLLSLAKESGPLPIAAAVSYVVQAAEGLAYAHEQGVIHRDIKPANLVLDCFGMIKILDLGLARFGGMEEDLAAAQEGSGEEEQMDHDASATTGGEMPPDVVLGTIAFMAPEQVGQPLLADSRADIYSLGSTLYYLLTGKTVRKGKMSNEKLLELRQLPVPSARSLRADIPEQLDAVLQRMLAVHPEDRFQTMHEVIAALQPFSEQSERSSQLLASAKNRPAGRFNVGLTATAGVLLSVLVIGFISLLGRPVRQEPDAPRDTSRGPTSSTPGAVSSGTQDQATAAAADLKLAQDTQLQVKQRIETLVDPAAPDDEVWRVFQPVEDPTLRTELVHRLAPEGVPLERLVTRLLREPDDGVRAALLQAIGEYDSTHLSEVGSVNLPELLLDWYEHDESPAVHSAIAWLARRWRSEAKQTDTPSPDSLYDAIVALGPVLEQQAIPKEGGWYQTMQGQTMVVLPGPVTFMKGSPSDEPDRSTGDPHQDESQHQATIPYTFAIATTEVTTEQFRAARTRHWEHPKPEFPQHPVQGLCWDDAVWYCNRLSELEGLPPAEHCYELLPNAGTAGRYREKSNALSLRGYRLPTGAEWEYACRGGTTTPRYFGRLTSAARNYINWFETGSRQVSPVGMLKPNDYGLFDTLGNISEFAHDLVEQGCTRRRLRGGSAFTELTGVRAAARYYLDQTYQSERAGLRVARTMVPAAAVDTRLAEVQVGPPVRLQASQHGPFATADVVPNETESLSQFTSFEEGDTVCLGTAARGFVQPRQFRIVNLTDEELKITTAYLGGLFKMEGVPESLPPRSQADFQISVVDTAVGARSENLVFRFEAANQASEHVGRISGNVHGPILQVFEAGKSSRERANQVFDCGTVPFQSKSGRFFSIYQAGDRDLTIENVSVSGGFTVRPGWPRRIETQKFGQFRIEVDTSQLGERTGRIRIESSDAIERSFEFDVKANVIESDQFSVVGVYRSGVWLFDADRDSVPDEERIEFGRPGDRPITGDVNGDGVCDLGVCRLGSDGMWKWEFYLRGVSAQPEAGFRFSFGEAGAIPLLADITGAGIDRPAVVAPSEDGRLLWRLDVDGDGQADEEYTVLFGDVHGLPVVGDWGGDGVTDLGCVIPGNAVTGFAYEWRLRHGEHPGGDSPRKFGMNGDIPLVGDWDADGRSEIGLFRPVAGPNRATWYLDTLNFGDLPTLEFDFGRAGDQPVVLHHRRAKSMPPD